MTAYAGLGVRRLLAVTALAASLPGTAAAQAQERDADVAAPEAGRDWGLAVFAGYSNRSADGTIVIDRSGPGSGAATAESLGLGDAGDAQFAIDGRWRRWLLGYNHVPTRIDGQGFALAELELGNAGIAVDTPVSTDIEVDLDLLAVRYAMVQQPTTTLDIGFGLGRTSLDINLTPGVGQGIATDSNTPFGFLALELGQRLGERWSMRFAVHGASLTIGDDEIEYFDFNVSGARRVMDRNAKLDVVVGFRLMSFIFDYYEEDARLLVDVQLQGPYVGLTATF